ncbi:MAG TPA: glucose 1-dehydrogenase [Candidatus Angelobacter sp.]|jgi:NAD(P)-dependent dehydrogenase (short-subunit alcohol dehydrogenase family)|nr:glucose 1-dehydrogenase [Candidatus Angelobacter sp.]
MKLNGKVAIITGAASGIGAATARLFAREGAKIVIADIDAERGQGVVREITAEGGVARFISTDVSQRAQLQRMVETTVGEFGGIDILHNNAFWNISKPIVELQESEWDQTLAVTLKAAFLGSKYVIPHMLRAGSGVILNTASIHALIAFPKTPAYDVAKAGLLALTRSLALDYAPQIRANAILPGSIDTGPTRIASEEERQICLQRTILGRFGTGEEIARAALFLCSDDSSFVTGASVVVDGGWTIRW